MVRAVILVAVCVARTVAADSLSVTVTTTPNGGQFAPRHVVAIWIEDSGGNFVKTIDRWAGVRISHLVAWIAKSGQDADAVSGATIANHTQPLTMTWDLKNKAGTTVPDGTYTIRMELADDNTTQPAQNHQGTFTFVKGPTAQTQTNLSNGGFINTTISFVTSACNNGVVDPGEACDGNCPATCAPSGDACMPVALTGAAATCDAACTPQPITQCIGGDGCCAPGCDVSNDSDCGGGGGGGGTDNTVLGGCAAGGGSGWALIGLVAIAMLSRRRRAAQ
jgi:MYXO-CTERM domain-containing protein